MSSPEISVVMSVYNGAKYLCESVESILSQEGVDFEFIIINDGSTDESGNILAEYANLDNRIRIVDQENTGLTRALIRGCSEAQGKYIARQDADDISMPGRLQRLKEIIESNKKIIFVSSWCQQIGPGGEILNTIEYPINHREATRQLLDHRLGPSGHGSVMFRTEVYKRIGGYRDVFYYGQDSDMWLRFAQIGHISYVPEVLYGYRYWQANISAIHRDLQKRFGEISQLCLAARNRGEPEDKYLAMAKDLRDQIATHRKIGNNPKQNSAAYYFIASSLEKQDDPKAVHYFRKVVELNPFYLRAWVRFFINLAKFGYKTLKEKVF